MDELRGATMVADWVEQRRLSGQEYRYALDDHFLRDRIREVIAERGISVVVETGIAFGGSALEFCRMAPLYIGIDADPARILQTRATLDQGGIDKTMHELFQGNSPDMLRLAMPDLPVDKTLFFLDAHNWPDDSYWPLPDEVRAIPKGQGVLVFHDFHVPGKNFGVDTYKVNGVMRAFDYDLVKPVLDEWSPTHRVEYMQEADPNSSYRGAAFIYPS
jgi:predicted O-methyltransferase YrrM